MIVAGIDLDKLNNQFDQAVDGRVLILDGDGPAYVAAATVKRLDTAIKRFCGSVLTIMYLTKATSANIHLTSSDSTKHMRFQMMGLKPYQGNRNGKAKPALLEPLREAMADRSVWLPEFNSVVLHKAIEADDGMIQDAYMLKDSGVIQSDDKDLRQTPYPWYDKETGELRGTLQHNGSVSIKYVGERGTPKLVGHGPLFFWGQMLCGDTADNVRGLATYGGKLCGAVLASKMLENVTCHHQAANIVLNAYRAIDQNPLPEAWCLWLTRFSGDTVLQYFNELNLTHENKEFLRACYSRQWYRKPV